MKNKKVKEKKENKVQKSIKTRFGEFVSWLLIALAISTILQGFFGIDVRGVSDSAGANIKLFTMVFGIVFVALAGLFRISNKMTKDNRHGFAASMHRWVTISYVVILFAFSAYHIFLYLFYNVIFAMAWLLINQALVIITILFGLLQSRTKRHVQKMKINSYTETEVTIEN